MNQEFTEKKKRKKINPAHEINPTTYTRCTQKIDCVIYLWFLSLNNGWYVHEEMFRRRNSIAKFWRRVPQLPGFRLPWSYSTSTLCPGQGSWSPDDLCSYRELPGRLRILLADPFTRHGIRELVRQKTRSTEFGNSNLSWVLRKLIRRELVS